MYRENGEINDKKKTQQVLLFNDICREINNMAADGR